MNKLVNGVVVPLTPEEIAEVEALRATAPSETELKWQRVRSERNSLLSE